MRRKIFERLLEWKDSAKRKPLILKGARQVGKSWILRHFGEKEFETTSYISCDKEPLAPDIFSDYDCDRILRAIEAITKIRIIPGKTLIILDEIQEIPRGLSALKYLYEERPDIHIAVAGSLLGIALSTGSSFPVGKVDFLEMYPMDFEEFLWAKGEDRLAELIQNKEISTIETLHAKYVELLREYYFCGGMPEVVASYVNENSVMNARNIQLAILEAYRNDIGKHAPVREVERIRLVLRSLPAQMAKENRKFVYSAIRKGARAAEFEVAIQWLVDAGIVYRIHRVTTPRLPLTFYEDFNAFKLYMMDCGLFGAMADTDPAEILLGSKLYVEYKGAFTEVYTAQQLITNLGPNIYYYTDDTSRLEIDFLLRLHFRLTPIEVKAERNVSGKSLWNFSEKYNIPYALRFSMLPYSHKERLINVPLYAAFALQKFVPSDS